MNENNLLDLYTNNTTVKQVLENLQTITDAKITLKGLAGSSASIVLSSIFKNINRNVFCILDDKEEAAYFYNDVVKVLKKESVLFFPSSYKRNVKDTQKDISSIILRTEVLTKINTKKKFFIITYPEAICEKVQKKADLDLNSIKFKVNHEIGIDFLHENLVDNDFKQVDFVYEPGQFSIRGSIVDVFSYANDKPYRIDFFGDTVESIRIFEVETQLSNKKINSIVIVPDSNPDLGFINIFDYIKKETIYNIKNVDFTKKTIQNFLEQNLGIDFSNDEDNTLTNGDLLIRTDDFITSLNQSPVIEFSNQNFFKTESIFRFNIVPQPAFNKNFELLIENIKQLQEDSYKTYILSDNENQIERLKAIFDDKDSGVDFTPLNTSISQGFIDNDLNVSCYTDHQIFERYYKYQLKTNLTKKGTFTLKEISQLNPGDYVVHQDHGIGKFGGLQKIGSNGKTQEAIRLIYKDNDILFVSIHALHRISKYKGKEGTPPKVYKLGTPAWQNLKKKTKSKIKDIAKELIELYAKRKQQKGFQFSPDSYMNKELEASFIFEDTPDQDKATKAVKEDMENDIPMDRLVCGDVGFGKTEIAIRAAFKAVLDGKQVAILVPTTILALQHYKTFISRLKEFPVNINYISRIRTAKQQTEIKKDLKEGRIDILIGTHRIVGKDMIFKDLGLLIIDEEQKFGVALKEKLRHIKVNVDTLTLTATPIPRTLQFSLLGSRDLSIINTPPPNRYPIITELHSFNEDTIAEAINYEINRGGQVFFIHNRVQNIYEVEKLINRICPDVRTIAAHGQMEGTKLEKIMFDFVNGDYGVLIATTIIESGLDIPNANTIIINNAHNFGLSTLHQLRGRVGRSNKKAFAYLLSPPTSTLNTEARRRLKAIEDFAELGSGFNIALQDLDIRGAGNLLGGEQSGFIADIGFETYHKILNEAIQELKENEYKELYKNDNSDNFYGDNNKFVNDCTIDTDLELLLPESYIESITERMKLYKELDSIANEENLSKFIEDLIDRFGEIPTETQELFNVVRLRWIAINLGIEKIILKNNRLSCYFVADQKSVYFQSNTFSAILGFMQKNPSLCNMKEQKEKLILWFGNISRISDAIKILSAITV